MHYQNDPAKHLADPLSRHHCRQPCAMTETPEGQEFRNVMFGPSRPQNRMPPLPRPWQVVGPTIASVID